MTAPTRTGPNPDSIHCPVCWLPADAATTQAAPNLVTTYYVCAQGHPWSLRWVPEVAV